MIEESDIKNEIPGSGEQMSRKTVAKFFRIFRFYFLENLYKTDFKFICPIESSTNNLCRDLITEEILDQDRSSCYKIGHYSSNGSV